MIDQLPREQLGKAIQLLEALTREAQHNREAMPPAKEEKLDADSLIGLFAGAPNLSTESEEILQQEITRTSGWTWKQSLP